MSRMMTRAISLGLLIALMLGCRSETSGDETARAEISGFVGAVRHDFGDMPFSLPMEDLEHEFVLLNTSGRTREIRSIRATCGCLDAQPHGMVIAPDETMRINTRIRISGPGHRAVAVHVMFRDGTLIRLDAVVTAVPEREIIASHKAVLFADESTRRTVTLIATGMSGHEPDPVTWQAPSGLRVQPEGWTQVFATDGDLLPARHELRLFLEAEHDTIFRSPLRVLVEGQELTVGLDGWPWDDCAVVQDPATWRDRATSPIHDKEPPAATGWTGSAPAPE